MDILTIQADCLGHANFPTTMIYLHVRRTHLLRTPSPLDWLPTRQLPQWQDPTEPKPTESPPTEPKPKPPESPTP